jgi:phosphate transport system protein
VSRFARLVVCPETSSLERVGDYAKNGKRTPITYGNGTISEGRISPTLRRMSKSAIDARRAGCPCTKTWNGENVRQRDLEVDQMYNALFREFLTFMMEDPCNISACMHSRFIAKNVERGRSGINMAETGEIYMVSGVMPEEDRQNGQHVTAQDI